MTNEITNNTTKTNPLVSKSILAIEIILIATLFIILPFIDSTELMNGNQSGKFFFFFVSLGVIMLIRSLAGIFKKNDLNIRITWVDIVLGGFMIYVILNRLFIANNTGNTQHVAETIGLAIFYILFRTSGKKNNSILLVAVMVAGTVQAVYGTLQLYGIYPSNHGIFKSTGGFFNPGPYAGYLAGILPIAVVFYLFKISVNFHWRQVKWLYSPYLWSKGKLKFKIPKWLKLNSGEFFRSLVLIPIIAVMMILPALRSRASWLAVIGATVYIFLKKYNIREIIAPYFNSQLKKTGLLIASFLLFAGLSLGLYHFKKGSADGRALIWKVTAGMFTEKSVTGIGYEKFTSRYMDGQAKFFKDNPGSKFEMVADDNMYAFNEYLKMAAETGLIGLVFIGIVVFLIFTTTNHVKDDFERVMIIACEASLVSFMVFAMFSYPGNILPIKLNVVFLIAVLAGFARGAFSLGIPRFFKLLAFVGIAAILVFSVPYFKKWYNACKEWNNANMSYNWELYEDCLEEFERGYPMLKHDGMFLVNYGKALSMAEKHKEAIEMLTYAQNYLTNTIVFTAMGDSYKALGETEKAEKAYFRALNMIPSRFYPKYLLAKLYDETGQKEKAIEMAQDILKMEVKIESTAVEEIRNEMEILIKNNKK